jgi:hypothetical protein
MKTMLFLISTLLLLLGKTIPYKAPHALFTGAWKSDKGVIILSGDYFSYAEYDKDYRSFKGTYGGKWSMNVDKMKQLIEYNTYDISFVGKEIIKTIKLSNDILSLDDENFIKIDDGSPGKLNGVWLFAGRRQNGELITRDTNQPRKTMKILSGVRFQWIAYNTDTGEFFGTGGGTYSTIDNHYTENIEFFSRDDSRVGASLSFDYELIDGVWHHQGLNSKGEPLYEIWSQRK